jgi:2-dehydro-3-deoxyphosphogluconate aldolase/(4S)-4-hydroxy-2-oxoglutarate aldolase
MNDSADVARLRAARVVAVLRAPSAEGALAAADAVVEGGLSAVEITYSTPDTAAVIAELRRRHGPEVLVGAGTVRRADEVAPVIEAGAQFIVSPGLDESVLAAGRDAATLAVPGVLTPTEVMRAVALGCETVKLFPASVGGPALLRALREPFPDVAFIPTGGVTAGNVAEWLNAGAAAVGAGGSLCPTGDIAAGRLEAIRERARRFARASGETTGPAQAADS